jgi:hypothetical protein
MIDEQLEERFSRQEVPPPAPFAAVRARAAAIHRRRRRTLVGAALIAVVAAIPVAAVAKDVVGDWLGKPVRPEIERGIGRLLDKPTRERFQHPPRYVAGVDTVDGPVLIWDGRTTEGRECAGIDAPDDLSGGPLGCGDAVASGPLFGPYDAGLGNFGAGTRQTILRFGRAAPRVDAVRVSFEDGHSRVIRPQRGWIITVFSGQDRIVGHRPLQAEALDTRGRVLATQALNPWSFGGDEPPPPVLLADPRSRLLERVRIPGAAPVDIWLTAPGDGWRRQQCFGAVVDGFTRFERCGYPADAAPYVTWAGTMLVPDRATAAIVFVAASRDRAYAVTVGGDIRRVPLRQFVMAGRPAGIIVIPRGSGRNRITSILTP